MSTKVTQTPESGGDIHKMVQQQRESLVVKGEEKEVRETLGCSLQLFGRMISGISKWEMGLTHMQFRLS